MMFEKKQKMRQLNIRGVLCANLCGMLMENLPWNHSVCRSAKQGTWVLQTVQRAALDLSMGGGGSQVLTTSFLIRTHASFTLRTSSLSFSTQGHPWACHLSPSFLRHSLLPQQSGGGGKQWAGQIQYLLQFHPRFSSTFQGGGEGI